jgi:hypothetical protein
MGKPKYKKHWHDRMVITVDDYIKAAKRGQREAEQEQRGPGFHSSDRAHRNRKTYCRKQKHRHRDEERW